MYASVTFANGSTGTSSIISTSSCIISTALPFPFLTTFLRPIALALSGCSAFFVVDEEEEEDLEDFVSGEAREKGALPFQLDGGGREQPAFSLSANADRLALVLVVVEVEGAGEASVST